MAVELQWARLLVAIVVKVGGRLELTEEDFKKASNFRIQRELEEGPATWTAHLKQSDTSRP